MSEQHTIGNTVTVRIGAFGNIEMPGKVDTGATTSSLHAENIRVNTTKRTVSFENADLSPNIITVDLSGSQTVHTADNGGDDRPVIKLDIEVEGIAIPGALFNLNDRSDMDAGMLIGQNILQAGDFVIDVNKQTSPPSDMVDTAPTNEDVINALQVLAEANWSIKDLLVHLRTKAVNSIIY